MNDFFSTFLSGNRAAKLTSLKLCHFSQCTFALQFIIRLSTFVVTSPGTLACLMYDWYIVDVMTVYEMLVLMMI